MQRASGRALTAARLPVGVLLALVSAPCTAAFAEPGAITFTDIAPGIPGTYDGEAAWGDYDSDGDLDILLSRYSGTRVYRNDVGSFIETGAELPQTDESAVAWGDYDGDGDLDLATAGAVWPGYSLGPYISRIYRNDGGTFSNINATLPGVRWGALAWGDSDNDGDLDLVLAGYWNWRFGSITRLYRNDAGTFVDARAGLPGGNSSVAWGDFDNDGDLDLLLSGWHRTDGPNSSIYRNDAGTFVDIDAALPNETSWTAIWGDYDADGDLDILFAGWTGALGLSHVHRNDGGGVFTDINVGLPSVGGASAAWGDYDNDGDLDFALAGHAGTGPTITRIYRNDDGAFVDAAAGLTGMEHGSVCWGDVDHDGDLDLLVAGWSGSTGGLGYVFRLYRSDGAPANTPPSTPSALSATLIGREVLLTWNAPTDDHTPSAGLSYNIRVGTSPGGNEISASMAGADGLRRVVTTGNAGQSTARRILLPEPIQPVYFWSVQAIDGAFTGSPFVAEQWFQTFVDVPDGELSTGYALYPGTPNPSRRDATVRYHLPSAGFACLEIFDVMGRRVRVLLDGAMSAGQHAQVWNGLDETGLAVPPGIYFVQLRAGAFRSVQKLALIH